MGGRGGKGVESLWCVKKGSNSDYRGKKGKREILGS